MRLRLAAAAIAVALVCAAQSALTADQLIAFIKSSVEQKMTDAEVSRYLRTVKLSQRLSDSQFDDLLTSGLGPHSLQVLHAIQDQAQSLPLADAPAARPDPLPPVPNAEEQAAIIAAVREYALNYSRNLPNFLCAQQIRRKVSPGDGEPAYRDQDTLIVRLSYFEQKEDYKLITVNDRPARGTFEELGGSTSTGEFGTLLRQVFEPASHAKFEWARWARLNGQLVMAFHYAVEKSNSRWALEYLRSDRLVPAYSGFVFVNRDSREVMRLTQRADGIPPAFPIQAAETILDYDYRDISGRQFLLPVKAQMDLTSDGVRTRNEIDFRNYQKYSADAVITFK
ncbi:MAG TPA: hypothetical protein VMS37_32715 [Verrucomicrobiae bacterium]|nr:hypothetical protein [Verrucomicrobiae bacterium]